MSEVKEVLKTEGKSLLVKIITLGLPILFKRIGARIRARRAARKARKNK